MSISTVVRIVRPVPRVGIFKPNQMKTVIKIEVFITILEIYSLVL